MILSVGAGQLDLWSRVSVEVNVNWIFPHHSCDYYSLCHYFDKSVIIMAVYIIFFREPEYSV